MLSPLGLCVSPNEMASVMKGVIPIQDIKIGKVWVSQLLTKNNLYFEESCFNPETTPG